MSEDAALLKLAGTLRQFASQLIICTNIDLPILSCYSLAVQKLELNQEDRSITALTVGRT